MENSPEHPVSRGETVLKAVPASRYITFFSLAIAGCIADLATKEWVFDELGMPGENPAWWIWEDVFGFQTSLNEGALFGMAQGMVVGLSAMSFLAAIGIAVWLFYFRAAWDLLLTVTLGLITAGILGNLYDRLGMPGLVWNFAGPLHQVGDPVYAVRDWILVMIGPYHWPNFNIADSLLVCGAILLGFHALRLEARERRAAKTDTSA